MMKSIFIWFIILSFNLKPGVDVAISSKVINQFKDNILPIINAQMNDLTIPD